MKPGEQKARELVDKHFKQLSSGFANNKVAQEFAQMVHYNEAKEHALICVEEILNIQPLRSTKMAAKLDRYSESDSAEYWQEVKSIIKNKL